MTTIDTPIATDTPKPGVYHNISMSEYRRWNAINWHTLEKFRVSAKHGRRMMLEPDVSTSEQDYGAAFHDAMRMTSDEFKATWAVMPEFEGHANSKKYKDAAEAWEKENRDKPRLEKIQADALLRQQIATKEHRVCRRILDPNGKGRFEISMVWVDKATQELCKGRIDLLTRVPEGALNLAAPTPNTMVLTLIDFKTCTTTYWRDLNGERAKYAYHGQMAWYLDGLKTLMPELDPIPAWVWVETPAFTGKNAGKCDFDVAVMDARPAIDEGRKLCRGLLNQLLHGRKTGEWPGVAENVISATLRPWETLSKFNVTGETE